MKTGQLFKLLHSIRMAMGGEYTPQQLEILLMCHIRPGITQTELAELLSMPQATVSRNILKLGKRAVQHKKSGRFQMIGSGLIETRSDEVYDSRRYACWLSDAGKELIDQIVKAVNK